MERFESADRRWKIVKDWIVRQIEQGEWPDDFKLPSIRILARMFDTSITTVQRALAELEANAFILGVPRVGYFVSPSGRKPTGCRFDFSSVSVNVNHAVVSMLSQAVSTENLSLSSAVLHTDLTPNALLNKCVTAVASKIDSSLAGLVAPPGLPSLRRRIAGLMLARGVVCGPDDVLVTSGDSLAMELSLEAVAQRGATIAIETPTYYGILQVIERLGMRALPIRTHATSGIDVDHLAEALNQNKVDAVFLNPTLQNPRGFIMPDEHRARLAKLACIANVPIIEDDVFFDLVPDDIRPRAIKSYQAGEQTIYCSSFSKTIAPGYRVGWCVPGKYRDAVLAQMFSRNLSVSSIAQHVINEFIGRGYMEAHCAKLHSRMSQVTAAIETLVRTEFPDGTRYVAPAGGFIHWLEFPENTDMAALEYEASKQRVLVAGSGIFFAEGHPTTGLRVCIGTTLSPGIEQGLKILAACAHKVARAER